MFCMSPARTQAPFCEARITYQICGSRQTSLLHRTGAQDQDMAVKRPASPEGKGQTVVCASVDVKPAGNVSSTMMRIFPVWFRGKEAKKIRENNFHDIS